jgi:cyclically-permuted mutarotase family protein
MLSSKILYGQQGSKALNWSVAGELPPFPDQLKSLGFAGPMAGRDQEVLIIAGGANFPEEKPWLGGKKKYYGQGFLFTKQLDSFHFFKSFSLPYPLAYSANCMTPKGIVAAGGENENGVQKKVLLLRYSPLTKEVVTKYLPDLPLGLSNAAITYYQGAVYLAGGEAGNTVSNRFFTLDLGHVDKGWAELESIPYSVSHAVLIANTNGLFLIGGRMKHEGGLSDLYETVYFFDLSSKQWKTKANLPHSLSAHSGILHDSNKILIFGGDNGKIFHELEKLNLLIANEKDPVKKTVLNNRKIQILNNHPGFSNEVLIYDCAADKWTEGERIPYLVPVTTTAVKWNSDIVLPGGEVQPGIRSPQILLAR